MVHLLILCVATGCALWVQVAVLGLKAAAEMKEHNLHDFLALSQGVASSRSPDPEKAALRFGKLLASQPWENTFAELRPEVVVTGSGPLLRLVKRTHKDSGEGGRGGQGRGQERGQEEGQEEGR
ncbi:MAG: hypothetical protein ACYTGW_11015 [Planctomycetota bacterium]|jgi:hypothetical protein